MALSPLTSTDVGAVARDKINAAIAAADQVTGKQPAFDLSALLSSVSALTTGLAGKLNTPPAGSVGGYLVAAGTAQEGRDVLRLKALATKDEITIADVPGLKTQVDKIDNKLDIPAQGSIARYLVEAGSVQDAYEALRIGRVARLDEIEVSDVQGLSRRLGTLQTAPAKGTSAQYLLAAETAQDARDVLRLKALALKDTLSVGEVVGLSDALGGKLDVAEVDRLRGRDAGLYPEGRPGDSYWYFTTDAAVRDPDDYQTLPPASVRDTAFGRAYEFRFAGSILPRQFSPIEPNRVYKLAVSFFRPEMPADPDGEGFQVLLRCYDASRNLIATVPLQLWLSADVPVGVLIEMSLYVAAYESTADTVPAEITRLPVATQSTRLEARAYGGTQRTCVLTLRQYEAPEGAGTTNQEALAAAANAQADANTANSAAAAAAAARDRAILATDGKADLNPEGVVSETQGGTGGKSLATTVANTKIPLREGLEARPTIDRLRDYPNLQDYSDLDTSGNHSSYNALRRAILDTPKGKGCIIPPGGAHLQIDREVLIQGKDNFSIFGNGCLLDGTGFPWTPNAQDPSKRDIRTRGLLQFEGTADTLDVSPSIVEDIPSNATSFVVSDASKFLPGDDAEIISEETHGGLDGVEGFETVTRGEAVTIKWVGYGTNTVYLDAGTFEGYKRASASGTSFNLKLRRKTMLKRIRVFDIQTRGAGYGKQYPSGDDAATGPYGIYAGHVNDLIISRFYGENHAAAAIQIARSVNIDMDHINIVGRDLTDETNGGLDQSARFLAVALGGVQHAHIDHLNVRHCRRAIDIGSMSPTTSVVGRDLLVTSLTARYCMEGAGTHMGDRILFDGLKVSQTLSSAVGFRGTNCAVRNGTFEQIGRPGVDLPAINWGGGGNLDYDTGAVNSYGIEGTNLTMVDGPTMIEVLGDFQEARFKNILGKRLYGKTGMLLRGKKYDYLDVDARFEFADGRSEAAIGVYQQGYENKDCAPGVTKVKAHIVNAYRDAVFNGGSRQTPMPLLECAITSERCEYVGIRLGDVSSQDLKGYFGIVDFKGTRYLSTPSVRAISIEELRCSRQPSMEGAEFPGYSGALAGTVAADPTVTRPAGTWVLGQRVLFNNRAYACTQPGTNDSFSRTGSISTATLRSVFLTTALIRPNGVWINILNGNADGSTFKAQVLAISADGRTLTIDRDVPRTASALTVGNGPAVFERV